MGSKMEVWALADLANMSILHNSTTAELRMGWTLLSPQIASQKQTKS